MYPPKSDRYMIDSTVVKNELIPDWTDQYGELRTGEWHKVEIVLCLVLSGDLKFVIWDLSTTTDKDGEIQGYKNWTMRTGSGCYFETFIYGYEEAKKLAFDYYMDKVEREKKYFLNFNSKEAEKYFDKKAVSNTG